MPRKVALSSTTKTRIPRKLSSDGLACSKSSMASGSSANFTVNQNVEPFPGTLSTSISPPISSTNWREIVNPSPVPPKCRAVESSA